MGHHGESASRISAVVGLGNPGEKYATTRHNIGFQVVDRLALEFSITVLDRKFNAFWGFGVIEGQKILLIKPMTFMNRSGEVVGEMMRYFGIPSAEMLVVHDDLDMPCGRIRLVRKGGAGGHRGILSIIQHLGSQDFPRLKLGIGRPAHAEPVEAFVLKVPYPEEEKAYQDMKERGVEALRSVLASGLAFAMNKYNQKSTQNKILDQDQ